MIRKLHHIKSLQIYIRFILYTIMICSICTAQEVQLTNTPYHHFYPEISPDGNWIVYHRASAEGDTLIYKLSSQGGDEILVSKDPVNHQFPKWSDDGQMICYQKNATCIARAFALQYLRRYRSNLHSHRE